MKNSVFEPANKPHKPSYTSPNPTRARRASEVLREAIDKAVAGGADRDDMMLRLTLGDSSDLKRDRTLAISDISFTDGVMRFLGVKATSGGVSTSSLELTGALAEG